jgi:hypothetical protein
MKGGMSKLPLLDAHITAGFAYHRAENAVYK